jgi:hypothetical protein
MNTLLIATSLLLITQNAGSVPVIGAGREVEIQALFVDVGKGETKGWRLEHLHIPYDRVKATFKRDDGAHVMLELRFKSGHREAIGHTRSFDLFFLHAEGVDAPAVRTFARAVVVGVQRRDSGRFWSYAGIKTRRWHPGGQGCQGCKSLSLGTKVAMAWVLAFGMLLMLVGLGWGRQKPWRSSEGRLALVEVGLVFGLALLVRWWIVNPGPGNFYSRVPLSTDSLLEYPLYGPGFNGWILAWFQVLGTSVRTNFFAGAFAGALTVVPVYVMGWSATGKRLAGTLGALVLALWPMHALHSTTDGFASLVALLMTSSVALVLAAQRTSGRLYLWGGWLALGLAAAVRPEPFLTMPLLALLVLVHPTTRRLQFESINLGVTVLIVGIALAAIWIPVSMALSIFSPTQAIGSREIWHLLGENGGSLLGPPRTSLLLTFVVALGLPFAWLRLKWRTPLLLGIALLPAVPTSIFAGPDFISARYQLPLVAVAAAVAGMGLAELAVALAPRLGRARLVVLPAAGLILYTFIARGVIWPPPEPTFRLEYRFFRQHIAKVPTRCALVRVRWNRDLGLGVPYQITGLDSTGHQWILPRKDLDPTTQCLVYWRPASCRAVSPSERRRADWILPDCALIESSFRLEPIAQTLLPARTGLCERYLDDPVRVGFYRLRRRGQPRP